MNMQSYTRVLSVDNTTIRHNIMTIDNVYVSIRAGPWSNGRRWPGLMNHVIVHWVCRLPGEHTAPVCTMGRKQGRSSGMLWAMFYWETLGPAIHVDVTLTRTTRSLRCWLCLQMSQKWNSRKKTTEALFVIEYDPADTTSKISWCVEPS